MKVDGELKDRGRIKWTAMMLPEHIAELRVWQAEDSLTQNPVLNEFDLQLLQEELEIAYKSKNDSVITTWCAGTKNTYIGKITHLDSVKQLISVEGSFGNDKIAVGEIIEVKSM